MKWKRYFDDDALTFVVTIVTAALLLAIMSLVYIQPRIKTSASSKDRTHGATLKKSTKQPDTVAGGTF